MINAGFHVLAWALVAALVWAGWFREPPEQQPPFRTVAALADGFYLIGFQRHAAPGFGLLKYQAGQLGFRALPLEDWDGQLQGELVAVCAVPRYDGEVVALVQGVSEARLVHVQIRRWQGVPKTAILSATALEGEVRWQSLACGEADQRAMPITLYGTRAEAGVQALASLAFEPLAVNEYRELPFPGELPVAHYQDVRGEWRAYRTPTGSRVTLTPVQGEEATVYTVDGLQLVGLAAGVQGQPLSYIAADPEMGSLWRPLPEQPIARRPASTE